MSRTEDERLVLHWRLAGRLDEYRLLLGALAERPGLTVVSGDPWSGTSSVLQAVSAHLDGPPCVVVDARSAGDPLDLAMSIADAAVDRLARDAAAWWMGSAPQPSAAGLRLARRLSVDGIDFDSLRRGAGDWTRCLTDAIELLLLLAEGPVTLVIDHVGLVLRSLPAGEARELLGLLRAERQRQAQLDLVLVEHPDGIAAAALADARHPLYRAGHQTRVVRPRPDRFAQDLAVCRETRSAIVELLPATAELAAGVPALAWSAATLAARGATTQERARDGWGRLCEVTRPSVTRQWDALRRVHPLAQPVAAAISCNMGPHAVAANSKSVGDALRRLRDLGMAWQPGPRAWSLSDPLLVSWVRRHPPAWVRHRRQVLG